MFVGLRDRVEKYGFAIIRDVIEPALVTALVAALDNVRDDIGVRRRQEVYAIRHLLDIVPAVRTLAESRSIRALVEPVFGSSCLFVVNSLLFDKTAGTNWKVSWHQDCSIAVRSRIDVPGFGPWSIKAGVPHVHASVPILEKMLTVRVHLDDCNRPNGPLRVIPGSHLYGRLSSQAIFDWQQKGIEVPCLVPSGGVLLMKPLLLHASSASTTPNHRRTIQLQFAADLLPAGLEWYLH
jgi:ectoine hydroxylase-related dioxygenase (phytanoyl-CoA dioxygenase family)